MKSQPRTPSRLSDSLHHQLNMYALAASAAGAGALAISQPANAEIAYTPTAVSIGPNSTVLLDLNHDGVADFGIRNMLGAHQSSRTFDSGVFAKGAIAGKSFPTRWSSTMWEAYALPKGAKVGAKEHFISNHDLIMAFTGYPSSRFGYWEKVNQAYLGIRFSISGATHYGWARVVLNQRKGYYWGVTVTGYAYETIPGKPIIAGKTKGSDVVTVQPDSAPGSLGRLAQGRK
jgi:hypothetical protein